MRISRFIIVSALLLAACGNGNISGSMQTLTLESEKGEQSINIQVEIASTTEDRARGLMERESLPENQGMMFIFDEPEILHFWMRNTLIPLDIMFFNEDGEYINAFTMEPCEDAICPRYSSAELARFAIEMSEGFREENGIGIGWKIDEKQLQKLTR